MARVLITGMSGVGKSSALAELAARGHDVVETDEPGWLDAGGNLDSARLDAVLAHGRTTHLFVSATAANQGSFYDRFDAIVLLSAPLDVMFARIDARTTNDYGKSANDRELIVRHLAEVEPLLRAGATHEIVTTVPLAEVVRELEAIADGSRLRSI